MTTELKAKDFLLHFLKKEYSKRSKVTNNLTIHVERLHKDHLLTNIERTRHLKIINDLIKMLNLSYNSRLDTIKGVQNKEKLIEDNFDIDDDNNGKGDKNKVVGAKLEKITNLEKNLCDIIKIPKSKPGELTNESKAKMLDVVYNLSCTVYENELKNFCPNDFNDFDEKIKELISTIGCKNIMDAINVFSRVSNNMISSPIDVDNTEDESLYEILNNIFIPLFIQQKKKEGKLKLKVSRQGAPIPDKYESLIGNLYKIEVNTPCSKDGQTKQLHIFGFFEYDCVNSGIRTSAICNEYIFNKKTHLVELCDGTIKLQKGAVKLNSISTSFKDLYIQNMNLGEIVGCDDISFVNDMCTDYAFYQKYASAGNFKMIFADFIGSDLFTKFKIIKYLLLGNSSGNAGLLFGLTKESKMGSAIIADLIYKNLSLKLQLKLHKENVLIKTEIDKLSMMDSDDIDMKKQIMLNKNMPPKVKKLALEKLNEMKSGGSEYYKQLMYVKTLMDYPWVGEHDSDIFSAHKNDTAKWKEIMMNTHTKLQDKVYGHVECKETIVELLGKWFSNSQSLGRAIALQGPPGVGKTMIAMQLGKAMGLPFVKINLGSLDDGSVLTGHSSTYSGAVPGLIVRKMTEAGAPRCIMFFDELDKTSTHHGHNEISDVLIHVTDSTSNSQFNDKFFQEVTFPLNKVLFVFSFNNKDKIDPILLDRMEIIKVDPYSVEDKLNIVNKHLLKEIKIDMGMVDLNVKISDENIVYLIQTFTCEAGVRSIKRKLEKIFLKLNKERIFGSGAFEKLKNPKTVEITKDLIDKYLGKAPTMDQHIHLAPEVGMVNGLYATDGGDGGIIPIILYKNQLGKGGKFTIKITGGAKKVMIDSISLAFSFATNLVKPKYVKAFFDSHPNGLHVHNGDLSTSKDGPSGTVAYTLAFVSKILNMPIKHIVGLTGEMTGDCNVKAIGGLGYKLNGSKRSGIKLVFAPKENEKDLEKIKLTDKSLFDDNFKVILVDNIKEILEMALIENYDKDEVDNITYAKTFNCEKYLLNSCIRSEGELGPIITCDSDEESDVDSDENEEESKDSDDSDNESHCSSSSDMSK